MVWKLQCKGNLVLLHFAASPGGTSGFCFPGGHDVAWKRETVEGRLLSEVMRWRRCPSFVSRLNLQGLTSDLFLTSQKAGNLLGVFLLLFMVRCPHCGELLFGMCLGEAMVCDRGMTCQLQNESCKHPDFLLHKVLLQMQPGKRYSPEAKGTWVQWFQRTGLHRHLQRAGFHHPPRDSGAAADGTCSWRGLG